MAKFSVGDRVRLVEIGVDSAKAIRRNLSIGAFGTVVGHQDLEYYTVLVKFDHLDRRVGVKESRLESARIANTAINRKLYPNAEIIGDELELK